MSAVVSSLVECRVRVKVLVANQGQIVVRILRAAAEQGLHSVAVYAEDDADALHTRMADVARPLQGVGAAAYLDAEQLVAVARDAGCDAVRPGYGFLSERPSSARRCAPRIMIVVRADDPANSLADLARRKIAVDGPGGSVIVCGPIGLTSACRRPRSWPRRCTTSTPATWWPSGRR